MDMGLVLLVLVLVSATLIRNDSLALAAALLLLLQATGSEGAQSIRSVLERHAVQWGIFLLLLAVLAPLGRQSLSWAQMQTLLLSPAGLVAVAVGAISAYLAAQGLALLHLQPAAMLGLVIGSILGVAFFGGIPAGPLIAAGITAVLCRWLGSYR